MRSIISNPFFRIAGILAILYYGLFSNKSDPNSLRNRLSVEKMQSGLSAVTSKSSYIIENVKKAQEFQKGQEAQGVQEIPEVKEAEESLDSEKIQEASEPSEELKSIK